MSVWLLAAGLTPSLLHAAPVVNAAVNGASFKQEALAPGTIISIFGTGLASTTVGASALPLPLILEGTAVFVNSQPIPLFFVSPTQINAQIPYLLPSGSATLPVRDATGATGSRSITITPASPGIFAWTSDGKGEAIAVHADFRPVRRAVLENAKIGETIVLFCTGLGAVENAPMLGGASPSFPLAVTTVTPTIRMNGRTARVTFSGLAPGFAGLYQINFVVPEGVGGDVVTVIQLGASGSNEVTINVASAYLQTKNYSGILQDRATGERFQLQFSSITSTSPTIYLGLFRLLSDGFTVDSGLFDAQTAEDSFFLALTSAAGGTFPGVMDTLDDGATAFGVLFQDLDAARLGNWFASFEVTAVLPPPPLTPHDSVAASAYCSLLRGLGQSPSIVASDGTNLGSTTSVSRSESAPTSMFNRLGRYGSELSPLSAFNDSATLPPRLFFSGRSLGIGQLAGPFVTTNQLLTPRRDPRGFPCSR